MVGQILAEPGPLVVAWETWMTGSDHAATAFAVQGPPRTLGKWRVPMTEQAAVTAQLRRLGVRVGLHDPRNEHVWCADEDGFALWSAKCLVAEGHSTELRLDGRTVPADTVASVVSFVDDTKVVRGVRLDLVDGTTTELARDEDSAPLADPTYNADNLAIDASWARHLGVALAAWLGRPHVNQVP
jgi:hypothetical protein